MRRTIRALTAGGFFLLAYAPVPILAGQFLMENCLPAVVMLAALLPVSILLSFIPGKVGGSKAPKEDLVVRRSRGGDPDPDRVLRNEALPLPEKRAFPLRALVCALACVGVAAAVFFMPMETVASVWWVKRLILALIMAIMLPLALREVAAKESGAGVAAGIVLYLAAGVIAYFVRMRQLDQWLLAFGLAFILSTAFASNNQAMETGASVRGGVRPPASMRRRNRLMLTAVALIGCVVLYFDQIRVFVTSATQWVMQKLGAVIAWLMNLMAQKEEVQGSGGGGESGGMLGELGGESSPFWAWMENVLIVVGTLLALLVVGWFLMRVGKLVAQIARQIIAYMKKLTNSVGEEYEDEQESLFDWGETKKELGDSLKKRLARLTYREKKWEQMDVRERVRFVVRSIYRRAPEKERLGSLTIHEALPLVRTGDVSAEELANLYDQARYSQIEPDQNRVERLRKEAKV